MSPWGCCKKNVITYVPGRISCLRSSGCGAAETNLTSMPEDADSIPGLTQWVKDPHVAVCCGVGLRHGSGPKLPWLWHRRAAVALIRPLAWKLLYAMGVVLKKKKKKKERERENFLPQSRLDCHLYPKSILCLSLFLRETEQLQKSLLESIHG